MFNGCVNKLKQFRLGVKLAHTIPLITDNTNPKYSVIRNVILQSLKNAINPNKIKVYY